MTKRRRSKTVAAPILTGSANALEENSALADDQFEKLNGLIVEIMESFPPQITFLTDKTILHIAFEENASVYHEGRRISYGQLKPDTEAEITVHSLDWASKSAIATRIKVCR